MSTNNKISNLINSQVPFFVRNDHPKFIQFLEAYYEYLEQEGYPVNVQKKILEYNDIDRTVDEFAEKLYETYLKLFPKDITVDKSILLKHAKEFYLARGSEKSIRFLMNLLFNEEDLNFYYPKNDILRASDGKWYVEKSLRITNVSIQNVTNTSISGLEKFVSTQVRGNTSGATAVVERVDRFFDGGTQINELVISNIRGIFSNGEEVFSIFNEGPLTKSITANVFGGILNTITITNPGSGYNVGDPVIIESATGSGANVHVARVSTGNIASITVTEGGAGYRENDYLLISGGGGSGTNGYLSLVNYNGIIHPNTYNIYFSQINLEANTSIGNAVYSNLNSSLSDPANSAIANSLSSFVYSNTGPASSIVITFAGTGYTSTPSISIVANNRIQELGILGRMQIIDGGLGYQIGDLITFNNVLGGYGTGAAANVKNVVANGRITEVQFAEMPGHIIGGSGYSQNYLPTANVVSSNANAYGANIIVTNLLGTGGQFIVANTTLGAIERLIILNRGSGYITPPTLNLTQSGDGTAKANATVIEGVFTYPGRFLNDDGMPSSYNFLQDRDYYQNFSYVLRLRASIEEYRQSLKNLIHPAGMKMFGTYIVEDMAETVSYSPDAEDSVETSQKLRTYLISNNAIINYTGHGFSVNDDITIQFTSGNIANFAANVSTYRPNGIYKVANVINSDAFTIFSGKYLPGSLNVAVFGSETGTSGIYLKEDGYDFYLIGTSRDRVIHYKLGRQYDITTAKFNTLSNSVASVEGVPTDLTFRTDGTSFYISGSANDVIVQYNMSEAWNVNTASQGLSFNTNSALSVTSPQTVQLSRDGTYLYFIDSGVDKVYQLTLSEAWNVNTATYLTEKSIVSFDGGPTGLYFNANGTSMYMIGNSNDRVREFRLSTAWNVNTATIYANSANFNLFSPAPAALTFANNGSMLYITDSSYDLIHQLPMTEAWNVNTAFNGTTTTGSVIVGTVA